MKTGWLILMVAALLGIAGFTARLALHKSEAMCLHCAVDKRGAPTALAWMKKEFQLDDTEFQKVCALHEAYLPKCDAMCERIQEAGTRLSAALLQDATGTSPAAESALSDYEALRAECQRATLQHLRETALLMKPEAGRAYMQKVLPHLLSTHQHVSEVTR
jgi:hypothetical protein